MAANQTRRAATPSPSTTHRSQARRGPSLCTTCALLVMTLERTDGIGDVPAETRYRPAVCGGKRLVALLGDLLAYGRPAAPGRAVLDAADGPDCIQPRHFARSRFEALDGDHGTVAGPD